VFLIQNGSEELYASGYDPDALDKWADRIVRWARGGEVHDGTRASQRNASTRKRRDVFVYLDNDMKVHAPFDAAALRDRVDRLLAVGALM